MFSHTSSSSRRSVLALAFALACLAGPALLAAQENLGRGRVTGQVVDEQGAPIEGARVVIQKVDAATALDGVTDKKGRFAIAGFGSGVWRVTASKEGYAPAFSDLNVSQLKSNPPVTLKLGKLAGVQGLRSDTTSLSLLDRGNELLEKGDPDGALELFQEFTAKYPDVYQVGLNIAAAYAKKGDAVQAEAAYKDVLDKIRQAQGDLAKDKTTSIRALSGLGELALKRGDFAAARTFFSEALAISPEDEAAAYNVGEMLFSNQNIDEAIKYFELASQIKKDWPKPYYKLGFVYLNKGNNDKALENFAKFVALAPDDPQTPTVKNIIATIEKMKK
jgi:tetratricopeptide (TPR) repeat protein